MIISIEPEIWFIPKLNGNRDMVDGQVKVKIKRPKYTEHAHLTQVMAVVDKGKSDIVKMETNTNYERIIKDHVTEIQGLSISVGNKIIEPRNGNDLLAISGSNSVLRQLIDEICAAVLSDELSEAEIKN